jgi:archaellum component FlaF (FlaF/FlaG flagellin family)
MTGFIIFLAAVIFVASFVSFLIGRDVGETKGFEKISEANERLLKQNLDLKWENNRLNRAMGYYDDGVLRGILENMDSGNFDQWE